MTLTAPPPQRNLVLCVRLNVRGMLRMRVGLWIVHLGRWIGGFRGLELFDAETGRQLGVDDDDDDDGMPMTAVAAQPPAA